jgi:HEAT repeat protein
LLAYKMYFIDMYGFFFANMNGLKPVVRCGVVIFGFAFVGGCRESPESKIAELRGLARRPGTAEVRRIESALSDPDRDVRATALTLVAGIDPDRGHDIALRALDDPDGIVRSAAVRVLTSRPETVPLDRLTSMATLDSAWQVRTAALEGLTTAGLDAIRPVFEQATADSHREVRHAALAAAAGHPGLIPTAAAARVLAEDTDWENRILAVEILGGSGDTEAYAPLDEAVLDPHEFVRAAATRARQALVRSGVPRPTPPPASPAPDTTKRPPGV